MVSLRITGIWSLVSLAEVRTLKFHPHTFWKYQRITIAGHLTVGGGSDSGYEYFLKQWVLNGDEKAKEQCTFFPFMVILQ